MKYNHSESSKKNDVLVSAGHNNFHLLFAAAELYNRNRLCRLISGSYPTPFERKLIDVWPLNRIEKLSKFSNRAEEIPFDFISQYRLSELSVYALNILDKYVPIFRNSDQFPLILYGMLTKNAIERAADQGAKYFHYRAGFGQTGVFHAKRLGMTTVCDHSIAHPSILNYLVENSGSFPAVLPKRPDGFWDLVLNDIEAADVVLVNSQFVSKTFACAEFDMAKTRIIYQGVDNKFLNMLTCSPGYFGKPSVKNIRFLFAGAIVPRKGLDLIQEAIKALKGVGFEFNIAGFIPDNMKIRYESLLRDARVRYHGMLSQSKLASLMTYSNVFVFPSFAEGSARVVFEAMAAGCAIITTENAGTVLSDPEGGIILKKIDVDSLLQAMKIFLSLSNVVVYNMGLNNKKMIMEKYTQKNYGDNLELLFDSL